MRYFWLVSVFLFGLFVQFAEPVNLKEKSKEYGIQPLTIDGQSFISLRGVLKILGCQDSWGRIENRVFFIYHGKSVGFVVADKEALVGDQKTKLDYPPREIEGEVLIHTDSLEKILNGIEKSAPAAEGNKPSARSSAPKESPRIMPASSAKSFILLIDAGHGGHDLGAVGNYGLKEKDVNLDVSKRLKHYLQSKLKNCSNVKIAMIREDDTFYTLEERVQMAKDIRADIFFCVHTNSSRYNRLGADGFETYYPRKKEEMNVLPAPKDIEGIEDEGKEDKVVLQIVQDLNDTSIIDESKVLAESVQEKLAERLICPDRGAKPANFYVLKYTPMISVLTEIGFICNPNIEANLRDVDVRQAIGETLGNSIIQYLKRTGVVSGE